MLHLRLKTRHDLDNSSGHHSEHDADLSLQTAPSNGDDASEPAHRTPPHRDHATVAGVLDLTSQAVTHAVMARSGLALPEQTDTTLPAMSERPFVNGRLTRPRKGAWTGCGSTFLVPSMRPEDSLPDIAVHDFGPRSPLSVPPSGAPAYAALAGPIALASPSAGPTSRLPAFSKLVCLMCITQFLHLLLGKHGHDVPHPRDLRSLPRIHNC